MLIWSWYREVEYELFLLKKRSWHCTKIVRCARGQRPVTLVLIIWSGKKSLFAGLDIDGPQNITFWVESLSAREDSIVSWGKKKSFFREMFLSADADWKTVHYPRAVCVFWNDTSNSFLSWILRKALENRGIQSSYARTLLVKSCKY